MYDPDLTANLVAGFEGFRSYIYDDAVYPTVRYNGGAVRGTLTIGFGETSKAIIDKYRDHDITMAEATELLKNRLEEFRQGVEQYITVPLNVNQTAALVSWAYNVGLGAVRDSTLRTILNQGDYGGVRAQLMRWNKAGGKVLDGLTARRRKEADLFETPVSGPAPPSPSPTVKATYGWREIHRYAVQELGAKAAHPTPGQSYSGRHSARSYHFRDSAYTGPEDGCAVDYGNVNSDCEAVFDLFKQFTKTIVPELIWQHIIIKNGVASYYAPNDHGDHVHVAVTPTGQFPVVPKEDQVFSRSDRATFHISAAHSGLLVEGAGLSAGLGTAIVQSESDGLPDQRWCMDIHDDGTVSFLNKDGDWRWALDIPNGYAATGVDLRLWEYNKTAAQRFRLEQIEPYLARISHADSGLRVDASADTTGAVIHLWDPHEGRNQQFHFIPTI